MTITATRFATQIRTWLLIAGLTGLLIAIGGAIGGGALYLFVALAVGMNVVGYSVLGQDRARREPRSASPARAPAGARRGWSKTSRGVPRCQRRGCT